MAEVAGTEGSAVNYTPDLFSPLQFCEVVEDGQQPHQLHHRSERTIVDPSISQSQQLITHSGSQQSVGQSQTLLQVSQSANLVTHMSQTVSSGSQPTNPLKTLPMSSPLLIVTNTSQIPTSQHSHLTQCQPHPSQHTHIPLTDNTHGMNGHENPGGSIETKIEPIDSMAKLNVNISNTLKDNKPHNDTQTDTAGSKLVTMSSLASMSSIEYILATPLTNVQLQSTNQSVVNLQQPFYQMQLSRPSQDGQSISYSTVHVQAQPPTLALASSQNGLSVPTVVGLHALTTSDQFALSNETHSLNISPATAAVATQTTLTDPLVPTNEDEPQIVYSTTMVKAPTLSIEAPLPTTPCLPRNPIPVKRTWRRPWKKKKEREKKQPVKKSRKVKRKRIVMPKRNSVYIDPRHGPPVDTTKTVVQRVSEEHVPEPKQKRQRIKLNRNSGREYINRLGKIVNARKIGSPCNCPFKCWERMGSKVLDIFNNFWDLCDFNLQNSYLFTCLKLCDVKRRYTKKQPAEESRRQNTFEYFVRINGKHFRVCKKAFMSSHGLTSDKRLRTLFTQMKDGALIPELDRRGKHFRPNHKTVGGLSVLGVSEIPNAVTLPSRPKSKKSKKSKSAHTRVEAHKQAMYPPQHHPVSHIAHCAPVAGMQEAHHTYIPNGELYFPGHYLEPPQTMGPSHMNQIPQCQKMMDSPAYFMAGMKENTFHQ